MAIPLEGRCEKQVDISPWLLYIGRSWIHGPTVWGFELLGSSRSPAFTIQWGNERRFAVRKESVCKGLGESAACLSDRVPLEVIRFCQTRFKGLVLESKLRAPLRSWR